MILVLEGYSRSVVLNNAGIRWKLRDVEHHNWRARVYCHCVGVHIDWCAQFLSWAARQEYIRPTRADDDGTRSRSRGSVGIRREHVITSVTFTGTSAWQVKSAKFTFLILATSIYLPMLFSYYKKQNVVVRTCPSYTRLRCEFTYFQYYRKR
jgi:hypothetical protein